MPQSANGNDSSEEEDTGSRWLNSPEESSGTHDGTENCHRQLSAEGCLQYR